MARLNPELISTPCGMRLVHIHDRCAAAGIFGLAIGAGSASETDGEDGLAHFVEHTIFKGTQRRSSWHIINRMEAIGGELNAYTSKEETVVYSIFPGANAARAVELIADLAENSQFPDRELDKERQVVLDEIASYLDNPAEAIYDLFEEKLLAGTPLAHNILGSTETVGRLGSADCRAFLARHYTKNNSVAFYSGPQGANVIAALVDRYFAALGAGTPVGTATDAKIDIPRFDIADPQPCHQAHVLAGIRTPGLYSPERYAVALMANIAGGPGMNSLLNVELREKRGLVYNVEASTTFFRSAGYMGVYFGCDADDTDRCRHLCEGVFRRLADGTFLTERRLRAAKKQYLGQLAVASENRENSVINAARATLFYGRPISYAETEASIRSVTATRIAAEASAFAEASVLAFIPED